MAEFRVGRQRLVKRAQYDPKYAAKDLVRPHDFWNLIKRFGNLTPSESQNANIMASSFAYEAPKDTVYAKTQPFLQPADRTVFDAWLFRGVSNHT